MSFLVLKDLGKRLGARFTLRAVSLDVVKGEVFGIVGASGAGKTTLLRLIAGLERPDEGEILLAGKSVSSPRWVLPPEARGVGMVFQSLALWGHLTALQHLDLVMRIRVREAPARNAEAMELLAHATLDGLENVRPGEMSGGEKQRLALARAVATHPRLLLLDEPFAHVDAPLRDELASDLLEFVHRIGVTTILVSHDGAHVSELSSRIGVMHEGQLLESGVPRDIHDKPATPAGALMTGPAFLLEGMAEGVMAATSAGKLVLREPARTARGLVCLRPGSFTLLGSESGGLGQDVCALRSGFVSGRWKTHFVLGEVELWAWDTEPREAGARLRVLVSPGAWIPLER